MGGEGEEAGARRRRPLAAPVVVGAGRPLVLDRCKPCRPLLSFPCLLRVFGCLPGLLATVSRGGWDKAMGAGGKLALGRC